MTESTLIVEAPPTDGPAIAKVWIDRPPVNAIDQALYREIHEVFVGAQGLGETSVVILAGKGRHFCAGNDLAEFRTMTPANAPGRMATVHAAFTAIRQCPVPVIGAIHGSVLGTGVAIAGSCDLLVAASGTSLGLPEVGVGVLGGAKHLSRIVPQGKVREMDLTAKPVAVEELVAYGGIARVVEAEKLMDTAWGLACDIAQHSPLALRKAKRALNDIEFMDIEQGYAHEQRFTCALSGSEDAKEAVSAFLERRPPVYRGR